jgi:hypothetical protein
METNSNWRNDFVTQMVQRNTSELSFKFLFETCKKFLYLKKKDKKVLNEGKTQSLQNNKYKNEIKDFEKENKKLKEEVESYSSSG